MPEAVARRTGRHLTPPAGNLPRLTGMRAFAALLVFAYHLPRLGPWVPGGQTSRVGYVGVAFFFVLSGFVLTWSSRGDRVEPRRFWVNRVARVYPSHLVMSLVALVVPLVTVGRPLLGDLASIALVQSWFPSDRIAFALNAVSWSLSCEAFFYLLAPWVITAVRRRSDGGAAALLLTWWAVAALSGLAISGVSYEADIWAYTLPPVRSGEFAVGILMAELVRRGRARWAPPVWVGVLAVVGSYGVVLKTVHSQVLAGVLMTPAFALLIVAAALADVYGRKGVLGTSLMEHLGIVSFCFYLVHELLLVNVVSHLPAPSGGVGRVALALGLLAACLLAAEALHYAVERPAQRWIRARWSR